MKRVLLSGGMDSALCLAWAYYKYGRPIDSLFLSYGQRHVEREYSAALSVSRIFGVNLWSVPLGLLGGSTLTDEASDDLTGAGVVVPDRNAIMLRQAALTFPTPKTIVMGACADDHDLFPDCRPDFFDQMREELAPIKIETPLVLLTKREVVEMFKIYGGTALLDLTWSCYAGGEEPCGECGACVARARGMGR